MLSFAGSLRVFIALDPCDMRAGINILHALVSEGLKEDAKSGALFVFTHKRRRLLKCYTGTGPASGSSPNALERHIAGMLMAERY